MKKVLIVITTAFVPTGGLSTVMLNYYRNMDKTGLKIDFCSTNEPEKSLIDELHSEGSEYFKLPSRKKLLSYFITLVRLCRRYDIIHINANSATAALELLCAYCGKVKVRIIHNHNSKTQHPILNKILLPLYNRLYTMAIACSNEAGEWLYGKGNFIILNNAIDLKKYTYSHDKRKELRQDLKVNDECIVIGNVGKLVEAKNHTFQLEAFNEYHKYAPNSKLIFVGEGDLRNQIESRIKDLHLEDSVIMAGLRNDVPALLQAFDIFLFPSIYEGMPLSVVEAQASGLPCYVSTNVTDLINIGEDVAQLQLDKGPKYWAKQMLGLDLKKDRQDRCLKNKVLITKAGYNIKEEAKTLRSIYLNS